MKLQEDFFSSKRIKKLRKIAGGDTYTIIYLKMQLMAMKNDGFLEYTGLENTFAEELALDIDEEPENVAVTINFLLSCGLMETKDDRNFYIPYSIENTGKESDSAKRVRDYRERKALQCNADVTKVKRSCNVEKEKEKEIDTRERKYSSVPELDDAIKSFIEFRKKVKKPMTDRAVELLIGKLDKMTSNDSEKVAILNQSILNGWIGVFALKTETIDTGRSHQNKGADGKPKDKQSVEEYMRW